MRNIILISKKEFSRHLGIMKNIIYLSLMVVVAILIFYFSLSSVSEYQDVNTYLSGLIVIVGFYWIAGTPYLIYMGTLTIGTISNEFKKGTILLILTRPIKRIEFFLGKFLGLFIYGILLNMTTILFVTSLVCIIFRLPNSITISAYYASFSFIIYSGILCAFIIVFGLILSTIIKSSRISMTILFVLILSLLFLPLFLKEMSPEYQKKFPDPAFLFGSTNIGISEILGLKIHPSVITGLSQFSGIYKNNPSYNSKHFNYQNIIYPEYILKKPLKILNIPFYISVIIMLILVLFIFITSFLIFKRKEFY